MTLPLQWGRSHRRKEAESLNPCAVTPFQGPSSRNLNRIPNLNPNLVVFVVFTLFAALCARADTFATVTNCTPQALVAALATGSNVVTFTQDCSITLTGTLTITNNNVTLDSGGHSVTLAGNNSFRLLTVQPGVTNIIKGISFSGGQHTNGGALFVSSGSTVTLSNCIFAGNHAAGPNGVAGDDGPNHSNAGGNGTSGTAGGAAYGGAIYNLGTKLTLLGCQFLTNGVSGGAGGAGGNGGNGDFSGGAGGAGAVGAAAFGGAIYNLATLSLTNCAFSGNTATGGGGGAGGSGGTGAQLGSGGNGAAGAPGAGAAIYSPANLTVVNSTFTLNAARGGNSADGATIPNGNGAAGKKGADGFGGAVFSSGSASFVNSTFFANGVTGGNAGNGGNAPGGFTGGNGGNGGNGIGGHVLNSNSVSVVNCTFFGGSAQGGTNGVGGTSAQPGSNGSPGQSRGGNLANGIGTFTIQSSIVASNLSGSNGFGSFSDSGYNLSSDNSVSSAATSLKNTDPRLAPLADNSIPPMTHPMTMALLSGSLAIDRVPSGLGPTNDQRGIPRPQGPAKDSGAFEFVSQPVILSQPQDQIQPIGSPATFTVAAVGNALAFQWRTTDSTNILSTSSSLTIAHADPTNRFLYYVIITNQLGTNISANSTLFFSPGILPGQGPTNQTVPPGSNVLFSVGANGDPEVPLAYQWAFNGTNLVRETNSTLTLPSVTASNTGLYAVIITNNYGSITSPPALLTVTVKPSIITQPSEQVVVVGANAAFSVVADGAPPLSYRWRSNGIVIPGAIQASYTATSVQKTPTNTWVYDVVITNTLGAVTSAPARLTVVDGPIVTGRVFNGPLGLGGVLVSLTNVATQVGTNVSTLADGSYAIYSLRTNHTTNVLSVSADCFLFGPTNATPPNLIVAVGPTNTTGMDFLVTNNSCFVISGSITNGGGSGVPGINVSVTNTGGGVATNLTTDANGAYSAVLHAGSYSIIPASNSCYHFAPSSRGVVLGPGSNGLDFALSPDLFTIKGGISNGAIAVPGVTVRAGTYSAITDSNGNYTLSVICSNYTVTPTLACYVFTPASIPVTVGPNTNGVNFSTYTDNFSKIRGRVTDGTNALSNVVVIASASGFRSTNRTDSAGNFAFSNLCSGTYVLTPSLPCVNPLSNTVTLASAQTINLPDFVAAQFSISGSLVGITNGASVTLTVVGAGGTNTFVTNGANYRIYLCPGAYSISASSPCYQFVPSSYSTTLGPDDNGRDFHVIASIAFVIRGSVTKGTNGLNGVLLNANGQTALTDLNGNYAISNICPNSYTIIPTLPGYAFQPALLRTNITSDTSNLNFSAVPALTIAPTNNGSVQLAFPALTTSRVEASTNLTNWTTLLTTDNFSTNTPVLRFTDTNASSFRARYYRVAENIAGLPLIVALPVSNHSLPLTFISTPITNCQIVASTNLKDWIPIFSTNYSFSNAPFQFTDPAANFPLRYYRLSQSPGF